MKRILPIMLCLCLLLCGCNQEATTTTAPDTTAPAAQATQTPTQAATQDTTAETTVPATTAAPVYHNPLTGEPLDEAFTGRFYAVTIDSVLGAMPNRGISQVDVFFEMFINDYCTRGLAVFSDIEEVKAIRSTRYNFTDLALAYDLAVYHANASDVVLRDMYNSKIDQILADSDVGFRDSERYKQKGYSWEHTLFLEGTSAVAAAQAKGFDLEKQQNFGMQFTEDGTPADGEEAANVMLTFTLHGRTKKTLMKYDSQLGKYIRWQFNTEMVDENNGEKEAFENVIILLADVQNQGVYHVADLYSEGDGYFACGGKMIPIRWSHEGEKEPISLTLTDGTPLTLGIGSSYIAIAPIGSPVTLN